MNETVINEDADLSDADYILTRQQVAAILFAVDSSDRARLLALMQDLHVADIADLLEQINTYDRRRLIELYGPEFGGDILSELDETLREEVITILTPQVLANAVRDLDSDDVVDLVEDLEEDQQTAILEALDDNDRRAIEESLSFPEGSAGRLMQREVVQAPEFWTVGDAIDFMRSSDDLPQQFYHIVLVNPKHNPVALVGLGRLMSTPREVPLLDIVEPDLQVMPALKSETDVAYAFNQYHLISAPVVDDHQRLVGIITIDDAMVVLDEEHEQDILRLAGVSEESSLSDSVFETIRQRIPWLIVNVGTACLAALVISNFEEAIAQIVALAVLMPIVASMGGNAGTQALTVAVRAIATKDLTSANLLRVIGREACVGLINGVFFACVLAVIGFIWFGSAKLAGVIAIAMVINLFVAGLAGMCVPVVLDKLKVDPALASGAFVTTITDVVGFFAFLGVASIWLL